MAHSGRGFKIFISIVLVTIALELFSILGFLMESDSEDGNIGVVELIGEINEARPTVERIQDFVEDSDVKAIVLYVDSPGGAVGSSQEIHDAVKEAQKKKKIVVSMGNIAASGGYYVAAPADRIVAVPGTITGSLGVIAHFFVVDDLLKRWHLKWEVIKSGDVKDMGSPLRSLQPKERALLQSMTDDVHNQFIEAVAAGRKMPLAKVRAISDGRVFSGRQAKEVGLVDELGGLDHAIKLAARLGGVVGKPKPIFPKKERFSWLSHIAEGKLEIPYLKLEYRFMP